jgi:drug/metabolite transporter (DMT)-like permease
MPRKGLIALLVTVAVWGSTYTITRAALAEIGPFALSVLRLLIAFVALYPLAHRRGYRPRMSLQPRYLGFGLTGIAGYFGLQNLALGYTSAVSAVLIQGLIPAVTAVAAVLLLGERLRSVQWVGIALAVVGTAIVSQAEGQRAVGANPLLGNLLMVACVLVWAAYTIQGKRLTTREPAVVNTTASILAGTLMLTPLAAWELRSGLQALSAGTWLAILYLGLVASALTLFLWNYALETVPASLATAYLNLMPIVGVAFGLAAGEPLLLPQMLGGALTLAGVWVADRCGRSDARRRAAQQEVEG